MARAPTALLICAIALTLAMPAAAQAPVAAYVVLGAQGPVARAVIPAAEGAPVPGCPDIVVENDPRPSKAEAVIDLLRALAEMKAGPANLPPERPPRRHKRDDCRSSAAAPARQAQVHRRIR